MEMFRFLSLLTSAAGFSGIEYEKDGKTIKQIIYAH